MWIWLIVILIIMIVLAKSSAVHGTIARVIEKSPKYQTLKAEAEKEVWEAKGNLVNALNQVNEDDVFVRLRATVQECGDIRKGIALYTLRKQIRDTYDVDWDTAAVAVNTGLSSGRMKLTIGPDFDKEWWFVISMLEKT